MLIKDKIISNFNKGANTYNNSSYVQDFVSKRLANYVAKQQAETVLEIGCGTGLFSQRLVEYFPHAQLLLTDIAPAMVQVCQQRFQDITNVKTACMDGENITDLKHFDLISSCMTLHWFTDLFNSLHQLINKLAVDGCLTFALLGKNSLQEWRDISDERATPHFPRIEKLKQHFTHINFTVETFQYFYPSAHTFLNSLKQLGAHTVDTEYSCLPTRQLREIMRKFSHGIYITYEVIYGNYVKK